LKDQTLFSSIDESCYSYEWLKTVEILHSDSGIKHYYFALINDEGETVSFLPAHVIDNYKLFKSEGKSQFMRTVPEVLRLFGSPDKGPVLFCDPLNCAHTVLPTANNISFQLGLNPLIKEVESFCEKEKIIASCFSAVSEFNTNLRTLLLSSGYTKIQSLDTYRLDVEWSSFDEYVKSLDYHGRKQVRKDLRKIEESEIVIEEEKNFGEKSEQFASLFTNVGKKYGRGNDLIFEPALFKTLQKHAEGKVRVLCAKKYGKTVGILLCLQTDSVLDSLMVGFDYDALGERDLAYFNLAHYAPIKLAIEEHKKHIYHRYAADMAKKKRGCKQEITTSFIKAHSTFLKPLITVYSWGKKSP
jgi:predicted N-acyltransferase